MSDLVNRPTRRFQARSTMMLDVLCWFAGVGERVAAGWRRLRERFSRDRRHQATSRRMTELYIPEHRDHARH